MAGDRVQVSWPLVVVPKSHLNISKGTSPILLEMHPRGSALQKFQGLRGVSPRDGGTAAVPHSQLCLDSWEERVSDP
eukprot:superscaffoldBa00000792_g7275